MKYKRNQKLYYLLITINKDNTKEYNLYTDKKDLAHNTNIHYRKILNIFKESDKYIIENLEIHQISLNKSSKGGNYTFQ